MISTYSRHKIVTETVTKILHFPGGKNTVESMSLWGELVFNQLTVNKHGGRGTISQKLRCYFGKKLLSTGQSIVRGIRCSAVLVVQNYPFFNLVLQDYTKKQWKLVSETLTRVLFSRNDN